MKKYTFDLHQYQRDESVSRALACSDIPVTIDHKDKFNLTVIFHSDNEKHIEQLADGMARRLGVFYQEINPHK